MPYKLIEGTEACEAFGVYKDYEGEVELVACHLTKEEALAHLAALAINVEDEDDDEGGDDDEGESSLRAPDPDGYAPTDGMKEEAQKGLNWREEYNRGGTLVGVARARDIVNGKNLPYETVQRVRSYFARHEVDKQAEGFSAGEEGFPSAGRIAWALWGGDAGKTWADAIVKRVEASEDSDEENSAELTPAIEEIVNEVVSESGLNVDTAVRIAGRALVEFSHGYRGSTRKAKFVENRLRSFVFAVANDRYKKGSHDTDLLPSSSPLSTRGLARGVSMSTTMERRSINLTTAGVSVRAEDGGIPLQFSGYAALFNSASDPLPFVEYIAPRAFSETLQRAEKGEWQIKLLHGHDAGQMLAATGSGSLRLVEDERGLKVDADLIPSEIGKHVALLVDREPTAMSMSFGFTVPKDGQKWNADRTERTLTKIHLHEVSILSGQEPAYPATAGLGEVRALASRAGVDADQLSLALSSLSFGNLLDDDDVAIIEAAVRALAPRKSKVVPTSVLKALAEAKARNR